MKSFLRMERYQHCEHICIHVECTKSLVLSIFKVLKFIHMGSGSRASFFTPVTNSSNLKTEEPQVRCFRISAANPLQNLFFWFFRAFFLHLFFLSTMRYLLLPNARFNSQQASQFRARHHVCQRQKSEANTSSPTAVAFLGPENSTVGKRVKPERRTFFTSAQDALILIQSFGIFSAARGFYVMIHRIHDSIRPMTIRFSPARSIVWLVYMTLIP